MAQELSRGASASAAHTKAGFKPNRHNASVLSRKETIINRVAEITSERDRIHNTGVAEALKEAKVTADSILAELEAARAMAERLEDPGNMARSSLGKAKLAGLLIERQQIQTEVTVSDMTDEELIEARAGLPLDLCHEMGLDPDQTTVMQLAGALLEALTEEAEPPVQYRHMPPLPDSARGNRAPDHKRLPRPEKPLLRGEAERLRRTPQTDGVGMNGVGPNGRGR
jgi:hypothetical protein